MSIQTILLLTVIGLAAGILSGMVGIGGGVVLVPALVFLLGLNQHQAQGTSLFVLSLPARFQTHLTPSRSLGKINFWSTYGLCFYSIDTRRLPRNQTR